VLLTPEIAIVFFGGFEQFPTAIGGVETTAIAQALHFGVAQRFEAARDLKILLQHPQRVHATDRRRYWQAHGIAKRFSGSHRAVPHHLSAAAHALHAEHRRTATIQLRKHLLLKAAKIRIEAVQGHLHRVEGKALRQHFEMYGRILVACKANEPDFAFFLGLY
jgi:hypothetical protein